MGSGKLLGLLGALIYFVFTLLPNASTEAYRWPWVMIAQVGLLCMAIAALLGLWRKQSPFYWLGHHLDWPITLLFINLCLGVIFAPFRSQALWQSLIAFGCLAAIYAVNNYLSQDVITSDQTKSVKERWSETITIAAPKLRAKYSPKLINLLTFQGILSLVFIVESLANWLVTVLFPKLGEIQQLRQAGVKASFDFFDLANRNAAPLGHQNYVAGFLLLSMPILVGLAIAQKGIWRKVWAAGVVLGLVDLYTTSSRGGILALTVVGSAALLLLLWRSQIKRLWLGLGGLGFITAIALTFVFNQRLRYSLSFSIASLGNWLSGSGIDNPGFRAITTYTGWQIGLHHWLVGAGAGATPMLYQKFRPVWAARMAEMIAQLHSTPVQIWAELGLWGIVTSFLAIILLLALLIRLHRQPKWQADRQAQVFTYCLYGSLLGYGTIAITDYQLDIFAISGSLILILACIAHLGQVYGYGELPANGSSENLEPDQSNEPNDQDEQNESTVNEDLADPIEVSTITPTPDQSPQPSSEQILRPRLLPQLGDRPRNLVAPAATVFLLAGLVWLTPVHMAWQSSSVGFIFLDNARYYLEEEQDPTAGLENLDRFAKSLERAHNLAPWEPYYAYQLGWNLGDLGIRAAGLGIPPDVAQQMQTNAYGWFKSGIEADPNQEFGYTNAGWLQLITQSEIDRTNPADKFERALELLPIRRSLNFGLGLSWLQQQRPEEAIAAIAQECLYNPIFITNPGLQAAPFFPQVLSEVDRHYDEALAKLTDHPAKYRTVKLVQTLIHFWTAANRDRQQLLTDLRELEHQPISLLADAIANQPQNLTSTIENPQTAIEMLIAAWFTDSDPATRGALITRAWATAQKRLPSEFEQVQIAAIVERMNRSNSFLAWLTDPVIGTPLLREYRTARPGFGILARHEDGPDPTDLLPLQDNAIASVFFEPYFLDRATQILINLNFQSSAQ
ncbi:O-antigen polymerase [Thalassoporum mexicanum PCC 7367]|uniref:O-antigen ligase family protein n=1 Tax=Thalassoporum mexicanum TaxID=3457544 RepID=UPI00029F8FAE|nr:O-antigen ligase family protein [Pseudanabaena sp. PCC 7367]AFY69618.1 O-antigen polymerase [Pseudanabaena sp. PCC 7367]